MKKFEFTGKNVEKAIEEGLLQLNKKQEDVDIKILSTGGLFKKAKVEISFEEEIKVNEQKKEKPVKEVKQEPLKEEPVKAEEKFEIKEEIVLNKEENHEECKKENVSSKEFLQGLMERLNVEGTVEIKEEDDKTTALISSENSGKIIGYRGECLNAIQYLTNIVEQRNNSKGKRVLVDIENYREKRENALKSLAERIARKVMKTGKPHRLEPMTPNERRIIHTYLQENKSVETQSQGEEPRRFLTVYPRGYKK